LNLIKPGSQIDDLFERAKNEGDSPCKLFEADSQTTKVAMMMMTTLTTMIPIFTGIFFVEIFYLFLIIK
jgi:hypothetical protein